jgi:[protein]-arginine 3-hydroxylase / protease
MTLATRRIPRARVSSLREFRRDYERPRRPVVLEGALEDRPALRKWSLEHLAAYGDLPVRVRVSKRGARQLFDGDTLAASDFRTVSLREAIARIADPSAAELWYVQHGDLPRSPTLAADIGSMPYLPARLRDRSLLWVCGPGTVNPMHWDTNHVLLAQVTGEKRFVLFPPEDSSKLASFVDRTLWRTTALDLGAIDRARFPEVHRARAWECSIGPGDVLFIPYRWWHYMESPGVSISVSWWWAPSIVTLVRDSVRDRVAGIVQRRLRALEHAST